MRTIAQINKDLNAVNAAIGALASNERIVEFRIGSGDSLRLYRHQEVSMETLLSLRNELHQELQAVSDTAPTFRTHGCLPMIVSKRGV